MRRSLCILATFGLVLTACGVDEGSEVGGAATEMKVAETPTRTTKPAVDTTEVVSDPVPAAGAEGTGSAMVGGTNWEFELLENDGRSVCLMEGAVIVAMFGADDEGREVALTINTSPSGGNAAVTVGDATIERERWIADEAVYDNLASIEGMPDGVGATAQVDGNTVSGSGVFYEDRRLNEVRPTGDPYDAGVLEGSFTATCPEPED